MFSITYKTTIKNILRSPSFLMITVILLLITIHGAISGFYVGDDAPDMVIQKWDYVECAENACSAKLMMYSIPIFVSFLTVLIMEIPFSRLKKQAESVSPDIFWEDYLH